MPVSSDTMHGQVKFTPVQAQLGVHPETPQGQGVNSFMENRSVFRCIPVLSSLTSEHDDNRLS